MDQERIFENLDVLLPFEVCEAYLEDAAVSLCWRGSICTIVVKARDLLRPACVASAGSFAGAEGAHAPLSGLEWPREPHFECVEDWEQVLRTAPELQSGEGARLFKKETLRVHEEKEGADNLD